MTKLEPVLSKRKVQVVKNSTCHVTRSLRLEYMNKEAPIFSPVPMIETSVLGFIHEISLFVIMALF